MRCIYPLILLIFLDSVFRFSLVYVSAKARPSFYGQFKFGVFYFRDENSLDNTVELLNSCKIEEEISRNIVSQYIASFGLTVNQILTIRSNSHRYYSLSHELVSCVSGRKNSEKELLFQMAISLYPMNIYAYKNLAYMIEWIGETAVAFSLYSTCGNITRDIGCLLQSALCSPSIIWSERQAYEYQIKAIKLLGDVMMREFVNRTSMDPLEHLQDPYLAFRELQLNIQYLGLSPRIAYELFSNIMYVEFPSLGYVFGKFRREGVNTASLSMTVGDIITLPTIKTSLLHSRDADKTNGSNNQVHGDESCYLHLGIVSEHDGNSSPSLCMLNVFNKIVQLSQEVGKRICVVYFERPDSILAFTEIMRQTSTTVLSLNVNNLTSSQELIDRARVDVLLYLALPTEKFTFLLGHARLAPIQIQFGIGHPISSGIRSIDYSVIANSMCPPTFLMTQSTDVSSTDCALIAARECNTDNISACQNLLPKACCSSGYGAFSYTEQLVQFDSLGYHLDDPATFYSGTDDADVLDQFKYFRLNATLSAVLALVGGDVSARKYLTH